MAEPQCPSCEISGMSHIVSKDSVERSKTKQPWFLAIHCDSCGHVYGVLAKHTFSQPVTPKLTLPSL
jgi:uncharacterized Zn finger protein